MYLKSACMQYLRGTYYNVMNPWQKYQCSPLVKLIDGWIVVTIHNTPHTKRSLSKVRLEEQNTLYWKVLAGRASERTVYYTCYYQGKEKAGILYPSAHTLLDKDLRIVGSARSGEPILNVAHQPFQKAFSVCEVGQLIEPSCCFCRWMDILYSPCLSNATLGSGP